MDGFKIFKEEDNMGPHIPMNCPKRYPHKMKEHLERQNKLKNNSNTVESCQFLGGILESCETRGVLQHSCCTNNSSVNRKTTNEAEHPPTTATINANCPVIMLTPGSEPQSSANSPNK